MMGYQCMKTHPHECLQMCLVSLLAVAFLYHHTGHTLDALGPVVLVVCLPGHVFKILHVCANEHVPQLHKVAVSRVLYCKRVFTSVFK